MKIKIIFVAIAAVWLQISASAADAKFTPPDSPRATYNFNPGWKFIREDVTNAEQVSFDDSKWSDVSLPHTWNDVDSYRALISHPNGDQTIYLGVGWYRKHFKLPANAEDRKIFIEFEGLRQAAHFFLNGKSVGLYENGITACGLDLTALVKFGGQDNVLAVKVDNRPDYKEEATGTEFEWKNSNSNPNFGGLTRNAWLHVMGKVYQTMPLYENLKTTGVYVFGKNYDIPGKSTEVNVESQVRNESASEAPASLSEVVVDADGNIRAQIKGASQNLASGQTATLTAAGPLTGAHFWDVNDPYLYDVYSILTVNGKVADVCKIHTGFRKAEFKGGTGTGGVYLNDKFVWLTGYSQRAANDWPGLGSAYPDWMHDFDRRAAAREQRQLRPLDAHLAHARGRDRLRQVRHRQCLSRWRRRARDHRTPMGSARRSHARLDDLFPKQSEHPFLGGGQRRHQRGSHETDGGHAQGI